jgi:hypothetical protein
MLLTRKSVSTIENSPLDSLGNIFNIKNVDRGVRNPTITGHSCVSTAIISSRFAAINTQAKWFNCAVRGVTKLRYRYIAHNDNTSKGTL